MPIDGESYEKAMKYVGGDKEKTPSLEEQVKLAKEQEAAAKKVADDVIRSQRFAKKGNEELNQSRLGATDALMLGFEDFSKPILTKSPDTNPLALNQKPTNTPPRIPEVGAQGVFPENRANTTPEVTPTTPTQTVEKQNDAPDVLLSGSLTSTEVKQAETAQQSIESGNASPDKLQDIKNTLKNVYNSLPDGLKNLLGPLLALFTNNADINGTNKANEQTKEKTPEEKELLAKLEGTEIILGGNKAKLDTSKITLEKTPGSNNFKLKSTQNGFQFIDGPLEVNPDGKIQAPNNTIALKGIPWYVPGINDGKYSLSQVGKTIDIKPITAPEGLKA